MPRYELPKKIGARRYRILRNSFYFVVQEYGMVMLDGCPDYDWKDVATFYNANDAETYLRKITE